MSQQEVVPATSNIDLMQQLGFQPKPVEITTLKGPGKLAEALDKARARCKAAHKDSTNTFHKYRYASAESILDEAKAALEGTGVALIPVRNELQVRGSGPNAVLNCHRWMLLTHSSGEAVPVEFDWPVIPDRGRPTDKAYASALTTGLAYYLRDLLTMPRVDPEDDIAGREDRDESAAAPPPKPPPPAAKPANGTPAKQDVHPQTAAEMILRVRACEKAVADHGLGQPQDVLAYLSQEAAKRFLPARLPDEFGKWSPKDLALGYTLLLRWYRDREAQKKAGTLGKAPRPDLDEEMDAAMAMEMDPFQGNDA